MTSHPASGGVASGARPASSRQRARTRRSSARAQPTTNPDLSSLWTRRRPGSPVPAAALATQEAARAQSGVRNSRDWIGTRLAGVTAGAGCLERTGQADAGSRGGEQDRRNGGGCLLVALFWTHSRQPAEVDHLGAQDRCGHEKELLHVAALYAKADRKRHSLSTRPQAPRDTAVATARPPWESATRASPAGTIGAYPRLEQRGERTRARPTVYSAHAPARPVAEITALLWFTSHE